MVYTPNLELNKQEKGAVDWHLPINEAFDTLDSTALIVDTWDNRENYVPAADQLFYAHDEQLLYRWDGESWEAKGWGSPTKPVAAGHVKQIDVGTSALVGSGSRKTITNGDVTVTVDESGDGDYTSIQAALDRVPILVRHRYEIKIADGTYDEDVIVKPYLVGGLNSGTAYERGGVLIVGNQSSPDRVKINSLTLNGVGSGAVEPYVAGIRVTSTNPFDDEDASIVAYGCNHVSLANVECRATATRAVEAYGSKMTINGVDIGSGTYQDGFTTKHGGQLYIQESTGSAARNAMKADKGMILFDGANATRSEGFGVDFGVIQDVSNGEFWGLERVPGRLQIYGYTGGFGVDKSKAGAKDLTTTPGNWDGEIQFHDGIGTPPEGYYEWDAEDSTWYGIGRAQGTTI